MNPLVARAWLAAKPAVIWLLKKVGLEWAVNRIEAAVDGIGNRQKAIMKARSLKNGRFGGVIVEDKARWVVFADEEPRAVFPSIEGNLIEEMRDYKLSNLRSPEDLDLQRTRRWASEQLGALATRLRRGGRDREASITSEPDAQARSSVEPDPHTTTATRRTPIGELQGAAGKLGFEAVVARLPTLLDELSRCPARPVAEHAQIPAVPGVYLFSEGPTPFYVGNTRNLRQCLRQQTGTNSRENEAALAWRLALQESERRGLGVAGTRKEIEADPAFTEVFRDARHRVRGMDVRFLEIDDPITRTVFEVYATQALGTDEFNTFETH
jgi:hypothetical protein